MSNRNLTIKLFYELTKVNFGLEIELLREGSYKDRPIVLIYPYTEDEIEYYQTYRIDVDIYSDVFSFTYKNNHIKCEIDDGLEASQYLVFKALKDIYEMTGIKKELLPESRFTSKWN